jgi:hypothetical protein
MPYQTCIDCGTREHSRCYNSTAIRINNDTNRGARPSDQRKLEETIEKLCYSVASDAGEIWELQVKVKTLEYHVERLEKLVDRHKEIEHW